MFRRGTCWLWVCCAVTSAQTFAGPGFEGLGDLTGGSYSSSAYDVSDDGSVVVGDSYGTSGKSGFRWTASAGMQALDMPTATAVNADGSVVAGKNIRWTSTTGPVVMQGLSDIDFGASSTGISGSGAVVVGTWDLSHSFRWAAPAGPATAVANFSSAVDVSSDGKAVLGINAQGAAIWRAATGVTPLGSLPNEAANFPTALSHDASVAVGFSIDNEFTWNSYRWTSAGGMVPIDHLFAGSQMMAGDVSGDGSRIVGADVGGTRQDAFLWTTHLGTLQLQNLLTANGIQIPAGWKLTVANAISGDGRTIVGEGKNPGGHTEGWIVVLPKPGDANADDLVDGVDYIRWADNFLQTTNLFAEGDFNWDGVVNGVDYVAWADSFSPFAVASVSAVPEPSAAVMLFIGLATIAGFRTLARSASEVSAKSPAPPGRSRAERNR